MNLKTHAQKSIQLKSIDDVKTGDVIIFNDDNAHNDATEQLGVVYRFAKQKGQSLAVAILPLSAVSPADFNANREAYVARSNYRFIINPQSAHLKDMGVSLSHHYVIGSSVRKYDNDKNIPDRDRIRVLPVDKRAILMGVNGTVGCLKSVGPVLMDTIEGALSKKFKHDSDASVAMAEAMKVAAQKTLQAKHSFVKRSANVEVTVKKSKQNALEQGIAKNDFKDGATDTGSRKTISVKKTGCHRLRQQPAVRPGR